MSGLTAERLAELKAEASETGIDAHLYSGLVVLDLIAEVERLRVDASNHAADAETVRRERDELAAGLRGLPHHGGGTDAVRSGGMEFWVRSSDIDALIAKHAPAGPSNPENQEFHDRAIREFGSLEAFCDAMEAEPAEGEGGGDEVC